MNTRNIVLASIFLMLVAIIPGFLLHKDVMFGFHDMTQASRVKEFALSMTEGRVPPRISAHFDYGRGYPVFNHYAPLAYYITSSFYIGGLSIGLALKVSFAIAFMLAGYGMFLFARKHMSDTSAVVSGVLYATSSYVGTEIFVRGNLAEMWFIAVFPFALWSIDSFVRHQTMRRFAIMSMVVACMLLAHNALSLVGGGVVVIYALTYRSWRSLAGIVVALLLSSAHTIPAVLELGQTHATFVAQQTRVLEHFVCMRQVWSSPIGFAGSVPGCVDGMSFQIGKVLIVMGLVGVLGWFVSTVKAKRFSSQTFPFQLASIAGLGLISSLMVFDMSRPLWEGVAYVQVLQFPWRMLVFMVFSGAFFAGYGVNMIHNQRVHFALACVGIISSVITAIPFFRANPDEILRSQQYEKLYVSDTYIKESVVKRIPEYVPRRVDYPLWLMDSHPAFDQKILSKDGTEVVMLDESPFSFDASTEARQVMIDIYATDFWRVRVNGKEVKPSFVDELARPTYDLKDPKSLIEVDYVQTPLQIVCNTVSVITGVLLVGLCIPWKRLLSSAKAS